MADRRKVELILGVRTTGATDAASGLASISKAAEALKGELSTLQRADAFKDLGTVAAQVAAQTGDLDAALARLNEELKATGASEKEIRKVSQEFDRTTASIEKTQAAQEKLGAAMAADAEKARAAQEKLGAQMAADIEKAIAAQAKLDGRRIADSEKVRAAQEKLGAALAQDIEKARAAQEKLGAQMAEDIEAELRAQTKLNEQRRLAATGATTLQKELGKISRGDELQKLALDMGTLARKTGDFSGAVTQLDKKLKALGANKEEIAGLAGTFESAASGQTGSPNRLGRIGAELRALPSTQIPGLGIGTDQVASIIRLGGALGQVSEKVGLVNTVALALTPTLGATAAGIAGIAVAAAPFVIALAGIGLALKALSDQAAEEAATINAIVDAQRSVAQEIANGLTTEGAEEKLKTLNAQRQAESELLAKNQRIYDENINSAGALSGVLKLTSGAEQALSDQIAKSKENIEGYDTSISSLTLATESGALAANDAAEAEKKLADERSKSALSAADSAGKESAARQKADAADASTNQKRLDAIANESEVLQAQIDSLNASGVTSEDVTAKIASLTEQLGLLGKESSYISDTALAASKARDAEKKAQKDAEDNAKKAQQAQEAYTKSVKSATDAYRNSVQDIGTRLSQTLQDNTLKLNRDLTDISAKYARDQYDIALKSYRAEQDAYQDQIDDLENIRRKSAKDEQEALIAGDFKQLYLARTSREEALKEEAETDDKERQKRAQNQAYALEDLRRANERQRSDRIQGYERANTDARAAQQRDLQQAALTRNRALQVASEGLNAELKQLGNYYAARLKMDQQYQAQSLKMAAGGASTQGANATSPFGSFENSFTTAVRR